MRSATVQEKTTQAQNKEIVLLVKEQELEPVLIEEKHLIVGLLLGFFLFGWSMILTNFKLFDWIERRCLK